MSKRKGDVSVVDFIERGWEPHPVLNWLALTGWGRGRHRHAHAGAEASSTVVEAEAETEAHSESTSLMSLEQLISEVCLPLSPSPSIKTTNTIRSNTTIM